MTTGAIAASTLVVGAVLAYVLRPSARLIAAVMAAGSGLLIGSVAYDLVEDAHLTLGVPMIAVSLLAGAGAFVLGTRLIERRGGAGRKRPTDPVPAGTSRDADEDGEADQPLAIVLGSVLDGVPESLVLGMSVLHGGLPVPLLVGIGLSNLPEGMAAASGLRARGWPLLRTVGLWLVVVAVSAVAAGVGHEVLGVRDVMWMGIAQTFAAGALLAMIADTMVPEAYAVERSWTGLMVVAGFAGSLLLAVWLG